MKRFTEELWATIAEDVFPGILDHPFVRGLTTGELPREAFLHYVRQDSAYLESYGRGLAILAAKASTEEAFMMFCEHARITRIVEQALHQGFLEGQADLPPAPVWNEMAPNGLLYTSYLMRVAYERPYHEAVAAYLPCYWIYRRVGEHLVAAGSPDPLYQRWIDTYAGEEFGQVVRDILRMTDDLAEKLGDAERTAMLRHFRRTSQLEYLFWDMGYTRQEWPF